MRALIRRFLGLPEPLAITNPPVAASAPPPTHGELTRDIEQLRADVDQLRVHLRQVRGMLTGGIRKAPEEPEAPPNGGGGDHNPQPAQEPRSYGPWLRVGQHP